MYKLNETTKKSVERKTGVKIEEILKLSATDIDKKIETRIGKKLTFRPSKDIRLLGRGSVYMALGRFFSLHYYSKKFDRYFS